MDTIDLTLILARLFSNSQTNFLGVVASDSKPSLTSVAAFAPCCYVLNIDPKSEPGTHWVAIYHPTPEHLEFFDSYGSHPSDYGIYFDSSLQLHFNNIKFHTIDYHSVVSILFIFSHFALMVIRFKRVKITFPHSHTLSQINSFIHSYKIWRREIKFN